MSSEVAQAPVYKDGWSWTYQATDKLYGGNTSNMLNGRFDVTFRGGRLTFLRYDGTAKLVERSPRSLGLMVPVSALVQAKSQYFQFPLIAGKKWKTNYYDRGMSRWVTAEHSVTGTETVTTPAGTFQAFRIERRIFYMRVACDLCDHQKFYLTYIYFYSPQARAVVKYHFQGEHQPDGMGDLALQRTVDIELIQVGSRPPTVTADAKAGATAQKTEVIGSVAVNSPTEPQEIMKPKETVSTSKEDVAVVNEIPSPAGAAPLSLRMNIIGQRKEADGSYTEVFVNEGSALRSHDNFQVHFETTSPAFMYILLYDSQGKASQLFPDPKIAQSNFVEGGRNIVIPDKNFWFWLDESAGTETIYVIASKKTMSDIKGLLAKMETADDATQKHASQEIKQRIAVMPRGIGGVTKGQSVTYTLSDGKKIQKVTDVVAGTGSVVRAVSFQHK